MTPFYPATTKPAREGLYLRDYSSNEIGGWNFDYWLTDGTVGYWYVNEPKGQWNDAYYQDLPWRGLTHSEYLNGTI